MLMLLVASKTQIGGDIFQEYSEVIFKGQLGAPYLHVINMALIHHFPRPHPPPETYGAQERSIRGGRFDLEKMAWQE